MRLHTKFILLIGAVTLGFGLISSVTESQMMDKALDRNLRDEAVIAVQTLAEHITHNVIDGEVVAAHDAAMKIKDRLKTIEYIYITDFDDKVFAHTFEGGFPKVFAHRLDDRVPDNAVKPEIIEYVTDTGYILDVAVPLIKGMKAHIHVGMSKSQSQAQIAALRNRIIGLSLILAFVGIATGAIVSRRFTRPLAQMAGSMRDFGKRRGKEEIKFTGGGREIRELTGVFNRMITDRKQREEERERAGKFLQTVIDAFPEVMMVLNRDYTIALANRLARAMAGGKDPVVDHLKCHQVSHQSATPCNCDNHPCPLREVIKTKAPVMVEHVHHDDEGREIIVEVTAAPILDEKGEVVQIVEASRDITKRKQAEEALHKSEAYLQSIFRAAPTGIGVVIDRVLKQVNERIYEMTGYCEEELLDQNARMLYQSDEDYERVGREKYDQIRNHGTGTVETHWRRKDGGVIDVLLSLTPIDLDDLSKGVTFTAMDITKRKQIEEERERLLKTVEASNLRLVASEQQLRASNQQLGASEQQLRASNQQLHANEQQLRASNQQANALNQQLIANQRELSLKNEELQSIVYISSHDLKTPLVNIAGFSEVLSEHCAEMKGMLNKCDTDAETQKAITSLLNEDIPTDLDYISTSAHRMKRLIEGLLQVSRIGTVELKPEKINMSAVVGEILNNVKYKTEELGAEIVLEDLPDCTGDKHQITQVFTNLIDNSLKYLRCDKKGCIKITGKTEKAKNIYCVEDNGVGIKKAYYGKIFEIYHRLNPQEAIEGDGLGLTIVRRILDRHKGRIWVESEADKGSKFFVEIPVK